MAGPTRPPQAEPNGAQIVERDALIYKLRHRGLTERQIAAEVDLSPTHVHRILAAAYADRSEPAAEAMRVQAEDRLDDIRRAAFTIRSRTHYVVTPGGKLVTGPDGNPLIDSAPILAANLQLIKVEERAARMFGTDSPEKLELALERRADVEAEMIVNAVEAAAAVLGLQPGRKVLALEAAACALAGEPLPEPVPEAASDPAPPTAGSQTPIMSANGVRYVVINGARFEYAGQEAMPEPIITAEVISDIPDADVVDADVLPDDGEGDPVPPAVPPAPRGGAVVPVDPMSTWPRELRSRASGSYGRVIG